MLYRLLGIFLLLRPLVLGAPVVLCALLVPFSFVARSVITGPVWHFLGIPFPVRVEDTVIGVAIAVAFICALACIVNVGLIRKILREQGLNLSGFARLPGKTRNALLANAAGSTSRGNKGDTSADP